MTRVLLIGLAGGVGSILRYLVSIAGQRWTERLALGNLPLGTLLCNVTGSLAMGFLAAIFVKLGVSENLRAAVLVGLLGGYTTFSSFAYDSWALWAGGQRGWAVLNFVLNNVLALAAVWVGYRLAGRWG